MRKDVLVNIEVSRFAAGGNSFEVDGSNGSIRFMDGKLYKWEKQVTDHQTPSSGFEPINVDPEQFSIYETNIYSCFARCLQTNTSSRPDFYDGLICQKVLDAVDKSIQTGNSVIL
jgi:predicted dehydrogenase